MAAGPRRRRGGLDDPRSAASRRSSPPCASRFIDRLTAEGLDELVPLVGVNLFGISVDTRLSAADHADSPA